MHTIRVPRSTTFEESVQRFRAELRDWAFQCMSEEALPTVGDGHDQASYTTSWGLLAADPAEGDVLSFLKRFRDAIRDHFVAADAWRHGYWRRQEAHHGTEHTELFLGFLYRVDPEDRATRTQLLDAAEHIGNWVPGIPPWFDWDAGVFRSMHLGTECVRAGEGDGLNVADHLRFVNIALIAYDMTEDSRYLDLATRHGGRWADAIVGASSLPAGLLPQAPVYRLSAAAEAAYHGFAGMAGELRDDVDRAENMLASGGVNALLTLWQRTGETRFFEASRRLLDVLASQLHDPDAGAAADAVRTYRRLTGDTRYDVIVARALQDAAPEGISELGLLPRKRHGPRARGIGKRNDKPDWFENRAPRAVNPIVLALQAEIRADRSAATRAVDLACATFALGRRALNGDRHHGCGASSDSSVARGHGRENGAGMVTAVLEPLLDLWPGEEM